jgi:hypothetical protein
MMDMKSSVAGAAMANRSDFQLQNSAQAIEFSRECMRSGILVNGGAAVAIVALLPSSLSYDRWSISYALIAFSIGAARAFVACAGGYFAQTYYAIGNKFEVHGLQANYKAAGCWTIFSAAMVALSMLGFLAGIWFAARGLLNPPPSPFGQLFGPIVHFFNDLRAT